MSVSNEDVYAVVTKYLIEICPDVPPASVTRGASMRDLGASSLDMIEVVSCSMRELAVRVPRQEISDIEDIDQLVAVLHKAVLLKGG